MRRKVKSMKSRVISVRLPSEWVEVIDKYAKIVGKKRNTLIKEWLTMHVESAKTFVKLKEWEQSVVKGEDQDNVS